MQSENQNNNHKEILEKARERFKLAIDAEQEIRELAEEDLRFSAGEQWPDDIKTSRQLDNRPCLTINRLPQFIHQITNDQRQNRPSIKVSPVDDKADIETAKIYQGLIRHIEYSSDADIAYDTAFDSAVRASFGYFRIVTEYCDPFSFDQEIKIKRIKNRFAAVLDPNYQQPDGSDANWGFVFEDVNKDDYKDQHPDTELAQSDDWDSLGALTDGWVNKNTCRIAEYFYKVYEKISIVHLNTGEVFNKKDLPEVLPPEVKIIDERTSMVPVVKWCKINGYEIIEETDWPGKWIPIIPVLGEELDINGKRVLEGVVRHAKDSQRMYNYWATSETETIALAPRAPYVGFAGQFKGFEQKWKTANTRNHAYLEVNVDDGNGKVFPSLPTRNVFEPPVQAITQARMLASDDLKSTTGIYDAALGAKSNENSGIAIQRRNVQAQTSNFHFIDNLNKSIRHGGRIIVDLIPHIYDTARAIRILGDDDKEEIIRINDEFERKGERVKYDLGVGKYDVTVSTGPSYQTKRQESAAAMLELSTKVPQMMNVAPDLVVKSLDIPDADPLAERLKKTLPPGLADDDENKKPLPPQVTAQMQQMNQMIEALTQQLNEANDKIQNKTIELESKERIEMAKIQANSQIELAKIDSKEGQALLKAEIAEIQHRLELLHYNQPIENEPSVGAAGAVQMDEMNQPPTGGIPPGQSMGV